MLSRVQSEVTGKALEVRAMPSTQSIKHFQDDIVALRLPKFCSVEGDR